MIRDDYPLARNWRFRRWALGALVICLIASIAALAAPQAGSDVPPDATPQIQQIDPHQAAPGAHVTVVIQGSNFSGGAYVSSVSAAVHVEASKRVSATQIEAQLSVSASAQPSTVSLLVSNPASRAAETAFNIVAGPAAVAPAPASPAPSNPATPEAPSAPPAPATPAAPPPPAQEVKPPAPVAPAPPAEPPAPASPAAPPTSQAPPNPPAPAAPAVPASPPAPPTPAAPAGPPGPEVTTIEPSRVGPGFDVDLKITGKNFVPGAKVSFANQRIRVIGVTASSSTELTVHIKVAQDAAPGVASLFVINPDDNEVEAPFEVLAKGVAKLPAPPSPVSPSTPPSPGAPPAPASTDTLRFDAFHLGNPAEIFQVHGKVKGSLLVSSGTIKYQEDGKTLVDISLNEIKEIKVSSVAPNTFHITTTAGKSFHFAPGSLRPSDARNIVDSLRAALPH